MKLTARDHEVTNFLTLKSEVVISVHETDLWTREFNISHTYTGVPDVPGFPLTAALLVVSLPVFTCLAFARYLSHLRRLRNITFF